MKARLRKTARRGALEIGAIAAFVLVAGAGRADVRTLEAVGTAPISPTGKSTTVPRDAAIEAALREAVTRVAQEFMADRVIEDEGTHVGDASAAEGETGAGSAESASESEEEASGEPAELLRVLGDQMVPYTTRFRVIEDRGRRPALFAEDPAVSEEYVVIVEVQVDVDRVHSRLVEVGLIPPGEHPVQENEVQVEVEGLTRYRAYEDFRALLVDDLGAKDVVPMEMSRGHALLDIETESTAVEFLEKLLTVAPPHIEIVPIHAGGSRVHVVVNWSPPAEDADPDDRPSPRRGADPDAPANL